MDHLFALQLAASFIVGGGLIALLSFIAERATGRIAGLVIAFPSTAALGFFFLGWTLSPAAVADAIPATFVPLGLAVLFPVFYVHSALFWSRLTGNKLWQILGSFSLSTLLWLLLALPMAYHEASHFTAGIAGYLALVLLAHFLLHRRSFVKPESLSYTSGQKIGRVLFVGLFMVLVVFLGQVLGPFWGGVMAVFPAAFSSALVVLHRYYEPQSLFPTVQKVAVGSISTLMYSLTVMLIFAEVGFVYGTFMAYLVSLLTAFLLFQIQIHKDLLNLFLRKTFERNQQK